MRDMPSPPMCHRQSPGTRDSPFSFGWPLFRVWGKYCIPVASRPPLPQMAQLIDGKQVAASVQDDVAAQTATLIAAGGPTPGESGSTSQRA